MTPGSNGMAMYVTSATIRSRLEGNRSARRHTPSPPRRIAPTTKKVSPNPMWNSHSTLPVASTASPVGFDDVEPAHDCSSR